MNDQIVCPNCKQPIPLTQALSHQLQEKYQKFYKQRLEEERVKIERGLREQLGKRIKAEMEMELKDKNNEAEELKKQNKSLQDQLLELNRLIRQLRQEKDEEKLKLEKKLGEEQEKIRLHEARKFEEEYRFKLAEKDKKIQDALKEIQDYKRKLEQGSQQAQGEVLELELENILKREFPYDEIKEVSKGIRGADVIQIVKNNYGRVCGSIIWESKRTKSWMDSWIIKLKEDQRRVKADVAVIITQVLPDGVKHFTEKNSVLVGSFDSIAGLAILLRQKLIDLASIKSSMVGKQDKKEILWNYLTSNEFKQRIDAMHEAYTQLMEDLRREREWFMRKWAREEKNIQKVADNILGMHGDLEHIVGKSLPEIKDAGRLSSGEEKETLF